LRERARESRRGRAEMKSPGAAGAASSAVAEGVKRDAITGLEADDTGADLDHLAGRLMSEDERQPRDHPPRAELPQVEMQIGAAHSTGGDAHKQLTIAWLGNRHLDDFRAALSPYLRYCAHRQAPPALNTPACGGSSKRARVARSVPTRDTAAQFLSG